MDVNCRCTTVAAIPGIKSSRQTYSEWMAEKKKAEAAAKEVEKTGGSGIIQMSPNFFNSSDELHRYAEKVEPIEEFEDVFIHGTPTNVVNQDSAGNVIGSYSAREFAELLRTTPTYKGGAVRLVSCETGAGDAPFAQMLANLLGQNVLAPTKSAWIFMDGRIRVGTKPTTNDGEWVLFSPQNMKSGE